MKVGGVAVAWLLLSAVGCASKPEAPPNLATPVRAEVAAVRQGQVRSDLEAGGVVRARESALVASRVLAPVVDVRVRPGDRVQRGATLITLDAREVGAAASQAAAAQRAADASMRAAEADVASAASALTLARTTHDRVAALYARRSATAEELDRAVATMTAADGQSAAARARQTAAMDAREAAGAAADAARISAGYATLTAPFDGVVTQRQVDPGSMAVPGVPLLVVEDTASYRLDVQIDESRAAGLAPGSMVEIQNPASSDQAAWVAARVSEISRVDPASHGVLVKIDLPAVASWRSGMFGRVRLPGSTRPALLAPEAAVVRRGQLTFVFLLDDQRARLRPVSTGVSTGSSVEVLAGLRPGDRVVVNPPRDLVDGTPIAGESR